VDPLFHIALAADWREAQQEGNYRISTRGKHLEDQGYIHLSFAHQVKPVADRIYRGADDLLLLQIDPALLGASVVVEAGDGTSEQFPHLYGELPVCAVIKAHEYRADADGTFPAVD
jgi:glutathione S-transferase